MEALTDEIAAALAQAARRKLQGDEDGARPFKEEASLLKEQKRKDLQRAGYPDDYMEMQYHCPCCRDTGFAEGKKCRCFRQMEIQVLYDQSNIREVLERENFDTLSMEYYDRERINRRVGMTVYDYMSMVIGECRAYVENFGRETGSILFTGSTGCGKTFLSNCIARELLRQCYSVVYLTATDMFDILSESRFGGRDGEEVRDRAAYIDVYKRQGNTLFVAIKVGKTSLSEVCLLYTSSLPVFRISQIFNPVYTTQSTPLTGRTAEKKPTGSPRDEVICPIARSVIFIPP